MAVKDKYDDSKMGRARKRVDELKGFYIHLMVYIAVNAFILINIAIQSNNFWEWGHFFTLIFWGIGLGIHAAITFRFNPLFNKNWEERQIKKYMERDREDASKFL
ncbi:2TM domain-containing protein [Croceivirga thetidis]|uniref:2TM domain-containing protein n=1 Tax=Croceivirga thetidis TaxID=2721623 RepID=A0ABX1GS25_9FLAO|nr:2TM domain-containing protein [Croceivirga thetidis]NKI32731.1 2TM domain-containing protein [Croceivirga thetidis]